MDSYHLPKTIFLILLFLRSIILWKIAYSKAVIWFMAAKKPLLIPFNATLGGYPPLDLQRSHKVNVYVTTVI